MSSINVKLYKVVKKWQQIIDDMTYQIESGSYWKLIFQVDRAAQVVTHWRDKGIWDKLFKLFVQDPDFEWLMIDASYIKVHPHADGAVGGNQDMGRTKGGSTARYTSS